MTNSPDVFVSQEELNIAEKFLQVIKEHDFSKSTSIEDILVVLDKLFIRFGYTIGCYEEVYLGNSNYVLYPHKINANVEFIPEYEYKCTYRQLKKGGQSTIKWKVVAPFLFDTNCKIVGNQDSSLSKYIPSIFQYMNVPYTKEGIWQLYLLNSVTDYFPLGWHSNYRRKNRILSLSDIDNIKEIDCSCYRNESILPKVYFIDSNRAVVECIYFSNWKGLCREYVCFDKSKGFFEEIDKGCNILIDYDCGITF